jgi:hypothetical protein
MTLVTERNNGKTAWIVVAVIAIVAIVALGFIFMNNQQQTAARRDAAAQLEAANDATRLSLGGAADASARAAQDAAERAESAADATGAAVADAADAAADAARDAATDVEATVTLPAGGSVTTTTTETYRSR